MQRSPGFLRSTRIVVIAALMATSGMLVAVGGAAGAGTGGLSYPPGSLQSLPDDSVSGDGVTAGTVPCPGAHPHPVGGGVKIEGTDPQLDLEVHATAPSGNNWGAAGNNNTGADAQMTIYAICAIGDYTYPHKTVSIADQHTNAVKVSCPIGRKVVGGGVTINGGNHSDEVTSSEPADGKDADHKINDAWFGNAGNGGGGTISMTVTAICASHGTYVVKVGTRKNVPNLGLATSSVMCPS